MRGTRIDREAFEVRFSKGYAGLLPRAKRSFQSSFSLKIGIPTFTSVSLPKEFWEICGLFAVGFMFSS